MSRTWTSGKLLTAVAVATALLTACERAPRLEVRTFTLDHLQPHEAAALIEPYVYDDREVAPGSLSTIEGAITIRETPDNLERITRVLAEFDRLQADVRLHFQLIEADGFADSDPRIAAVEEELRKVFQFRGYRLAGEAFVSATDGSDIEQRLRADGVAYQITGQLYRMSPEVIRLESIELWSETPGQGLRTTVSIRPGQTLVLGSSPKDGSTATLLLTVRAEESPGPT